MSEHWPTQQIIISEDAAQLATLKRAFASELLYHPDDPFEAARNVFGFEQGKALFVSVNWPSDEFVKQEQQRLLTEHGALHYLPGKADVARKVIKTANAATKENDKYAGYRLYSELMGFMPEKTSGSAGGGNNIFVGSQKVMVVTNHGSNEAWAEKCANNQKRLLEAAAEDLHDNN